MPQQFEARVRTGIGVAGMRPGCGCALWGLRGAGQYLSQTPSPLGRRCPLPRAGAASGVVRHPTSRLWLTGPCVEQAQDLGKGFGGAAGVWEGNRGPLSSIGVCCPVP